MAVDLFRAVCFIYAKVVSVITYHHMREIDSLHEYAESRSTECRSVENAEC